MLGLQVVVGKLMVGLVVDWAIGAVATGLGSCSVAAM